MSPQSLSLYRFHPLRHISFYSHFPFSMSLSHTYSAHRIFFVFLILFISLFLPLCLSLPPFTQPPLPPLPSTASIARERKALPLGRLTQDKLASALRKSNPQPQVLLHFTFPRGENFSQIFNKRATSPKQTPQVINAGTQRKFKL